MRALVSRDEPVSWLWADVPPPELGPSDVLVRVVASGLNRADLLMREGKYVPTGADWTVPVDRVGFEMAGLVRAVGDQVEGFVPGDRVMAQTGGACAELVAIDHRLLLPIPGAMGWTEAAGLPSALLTEFDALVRIAELRAGEHVLIAGATTGVGLVGVQLAHALGASTVVGTTRSAAKVELLRSLGATHVVDTSVQPINPDTVPNPVDVVLDHLGGPVLRDLIHVSAPQARLVQIGRLAGQHGTLDLDELAARRLRLIGTTFRGRTAAELHELVALLRARLPEPAPRAVVDSVFDAPDAELAAARLDAPDLAGKVVLREP